MSYSSIYGKPVFSLRDELFQLAQEHHQLHQQFSDQELQYIQSLKNRLRFLASQGRFDSIEIISQPEWGDLNLIAILNHFVEEEQLNLFVLEHETKNGVCSIKFQVSWAEDQVYPTSFL